MQKKINGFPSGRPGVQRILEPILLLSLLEKPSYGYELLERIRYIVPGWEEPDVGTLYRFLRRLEKEKILISSWTTKNIGPARRIYRVTEKGIKYLALWIKRLEKNRILIDSLLQQFANIEKKLSLPD